MRGDMVLFEWCDPSGCFRLLHAAPVFQEFALMKRGPFEDHGGGPAWKCAFQGCNRFDSDLHFIAAVESVEMRRIVVVEVHSNNDAEEAADLGHCAQRNTAGSF